MTAVIFPATLQEAMVATPRRPRLRATVRRTELVATLADLDAPPFIVLVAPAGFGKTTLLCEWEARDPRPFAWVTVDRRHDEPNALLQAIAAALDVASAESEDGRVVLVLDDVHLLQSAAARETVAGIACAPPLELTVALASRTELSLPIARLRSQGLVTELRQRDLAMTRAEAAALLRAAGLQLERDDVDVLFHRTEGWPVGLALAVRSLGEHDVPGAALARFSGLDRPVAEFLRDEVLGGLTEADMRFVLRSSVLDILTAPACDGILECSGSAATLARLARSNVPLVALDRTGERHRHHRLLSDMLRGELRRTDPDAERELHRRASAWYSCCEDRERALQHALAADELQRAADLVWGGMPAMVEQGSCAPVEHWLSRFTNAQVAADGRLALVAAAVQLMNGHGHLTEHWLSMVDAADAEGDVAGGVAAVHAALGRDGIAAMREGADRASALLDPRSPCLALCGLLAGVAAHLGGDAETARRQLEGGARRVAVSAPLLHALCLSQLALVALDCDDAEEAARLSTRARSQIARYGLARYPAAALPIAVSALVRAQRGLAEEAHADAREAAALLESLIDFAPWYEAEANLVLGRAALRLSDVGEARARLADARRLAGRLDAVTLDRWLTDALTDLDSFTGAASRLPSSLTSAELKILHFLPTHLSFREIAERTYVSANTVKTQANAVYRKLDVRSRSEAVACARELGLLDD